MANADGSLKQELSYDAWGRLRNPATHAAYAPGSEPILFLRRGYTGHEHLYWFRLINMNARLYEPALGRFLSPDPYVQMPDFTQNFNRYSYCLNNPLVYVDEDGEWFFTFILPGIGTYVDIVLWGATIEYVGQVINNYQTNKQGVTNYSTKEIWFGKIDWFDVGFAGGGALASALVPVAAPYIRYLSPSITNAINLYGDGTKEILGKEINWGDYLMNTSLETASLAVTDIWHKGLNAPSKNDALPEINVPKEWQDRISNTVSTNLSYTLKRSYQYRNFNPRPNWQPPHNPNVPGIPINKKYRENLQLIDGEKESEKEKETSEISLIIKLLSLK